MYKKMQLAISKLASKKLYVVVLLLFLVDLLTENYVISLFHKQTEIPPLAWFPLFMILQILFAPLQTAASDHFTRKKVIYVALYSNLICFVLGLFTLIFDCFTIWMFSLIIIFKSILGNLIPLGLVSISDMHEKRYRPYFLGTTSIYALAFILLRYGISGFSLTSFAILSLIFILTVLVLVYFHFFDVEDTQSDVTPYSRQKPSEKRDSWVKCLVSCLRKVPATLILIFNQARKDKKNLIDDICDKSIRSALLGYFWWEVSMYSIIVSAVDLNFYKSSLFPLIMMCGFLFGVLFVLFVLKKWSDQRVIKWGYLISATSLAPIFIFGWSQADRSLVITTCYFFHAAGNAFLSAAFMSLLAKERSHHVQGRTYGLIESFDSLSFMVGTVTGISIQALKLSTASLVFFSFFSFMVSFKYYKRFQE
ncbi:MAG: MFS transporter [Chlamydiales bacterium]|nr:MFS transporter [Chlamydiales bacterium]